MFDPFYRDILPKSVGMVRKFTTYVSFDQLVGATYAKSSKGKFGMYVEHHEKLN